MIFSFNIIIQLGTVLAMLLFFWKDLFHILRSFFMGIGMGNPLKTHELIARVADHRGNHPGLRSLASYSKM